VRSVTGGSLVLSGIQATPPLWGGQVRPWNENDPRRRRGASGPGSFSSVGAVRKYPPPRPPESSGVVPHCPLGPLLKHRV